MNIIRIPYARLLCALALLASALTVAYAPSLLPVAIPIAVVAALYGTVVMRPADIAAAARNALLTASAFGYPLFLGGSVLPWAALVVSFALVLADWNIRSTRRSELAFIQALAAAFAVSLSAAATQYFFPLVWRSVAVVAVLAFLVLLITTLPDGRSGWFPSPRVCAVVLILAEGVVILRQLPLHWAVSGAVLALAFAAAIEARRFPRTMFLIGMFIVFGIGVVPSIGAV